MFEYSTLPMTCLPVHRIMNRITKVISAWLFFQDVMREWLFLSISLASSSCLQHGELTVVDIITQSVGQRHLNIAESAAMGGIHSKCYAVRIFAILCWILNERV